MCFPRRLIFRIKRPRREKQFPDLIEFDSAEHGSEASDLINAAYDCNLTQIEYSYALESMQDHVMAKSKR